MTETDWKFLCATCAVLGGFVGCAIGYFCGYGHGHEAGFIAGEIAGIESGRPRFIKAKMDSFCGGRLAGFVEAMRLWDDSKQPEVTPMPPRRGKPGINHSAPVAMQTGIPNDSGGVESRHTTNAISKQSKGATQGLLPDVVADSA